MKHTSLTAHFPHTPSDTLCDPFTLSSHYLSHLYPTLSTHTPTPTSPIHPTHSPTYNPIHTHLHVGDGQRRGNTHIAAKHEAVRAEAGAARARVAAVVDHRRDHVRAD